MFRASLSLLALLPVWAAACNVYDSSLFDGQGGAGAASAASGGSVTASGGTATTTGGDTSSGNGAGGVAGTTPSGGTGTGGSSLTGSGGSSVGSGGTTTPPGSGGSSAGPNGGSGDTTSVGGSPQGGAPATVFALVDDFETLDAYGSVQDGRVPLWYLFNDMTTGTQLPEVLEMTTMPSADADARPGSLYALFTSSTGFTSWGSGVGVDLCNDSGKQTYDASGYLGISFYAKAPSTYRVVRVNVPDIGTDASGAICDPETNECSDHFGQMISLTADWKRYDLYFADLKQVGWGLKRTALDLSHLFSVQFQIGAGKTVELWVDDLSLIVE